MFRISSLLFAVVFLLSCRHAETQSAIAGKRINAAFCPTPQKITAIYKDNVYDLSGYEGVAGNSPFNLFDENAMVDPRVRQVSDDYHPSTSPHPIMTGSLYYPPGRGNRIVVDLQTAYKLSEVYLYDMSRESDSVWIYTGDMQHWKLKVALSTKGDITQFGWRKLTISDSSRYIMIRFNSWLANITEAVFYGCPYGTIPPPPSRSYSGKKLPPKTIREFLGVNTYQAVALQWMKPFQNIRMYAQADHFDNDSTREFPNQLFNLAAEGWWNGAVQDYTYFADSIARYTQGRLWYSILGVPYWMKKKGFDDRDRPITRLGMDKEDPFSYARHANMLWNMAALFGNTPVDTNLIQVYNRPRFSGRKTMSLFENGNEVDASWVGDKYCNPVEYFAVSSADYDGHEGKMGKFMGIKNADAGSELMMSGLAGLDTNRVRVLNFLCKTLRKDGKFLWQGGIQYHCYAVDGKGRFAAEDFAYTSRGASPEEYRLREKLAQVRDYTYRVQPGVECVLGEFGYDKSRTSKVSAPLVKGFNARQSQGIMLLRGINAVSFSGFDKLILYWIKDDYPDDEPAIFVTSGVIRQVKQDVWEPLPAWFYISTLVNRLGDYVPEKIVSEKGDVWIYQYRNKLDPHSVAYFVYCPSYSGKKVDNYSLALGSKAVGQATAVTMADQSESGKETLLPVNNGKVTIQVNEVPQLIFVRER